MINRAGKRNLKPVFKGAESIALSVLNTKRQYGKRSIKRELVEVVEVEMAEEEVQEDDQVEKTEEEVQEDDQVEKTEEEVQEVDQVEKTEEEVQEVDQVEKTEEEVREVDQVEKTEEEVREDDQVEKTEEEVQEDDQVEKTGEAVQGEVQVYVTEEEEQLEVTEEEVQGQDQLEVTEEEVADKGMREVEVRGKETSERASGYMHQGTELEQKVINKEKEVEGMDREEEEAISEGQVEIIALNLGLQALVRDTTMRQDLVQLLCQVLCKAFQAKNDRRIVLHLAQVVKDSSFFQTVLPRYVTGIMTDHVPDRRQQYPQHLDNIINLLSGVLSMFPSSSICTISMLVALLKPVVNQLRASGIDIRHTIDEDLDKIQGMVEHLQEKARDGTLRSDNYTVLIGNDNTPEGEDDFRNMTIYPTPEEFRQDKKPFLRANIMSQNYPSARIYLDTHFRLLREDFVRPLREGIRELLQSHYDERLSGMPVRKRSFDDIRVYSDTRLIMPVCTSTGIAYRVQFDTQPLKFVRWENSKRLLYGSLVCLSMDHFETFLFATVADRDPKELRKGQVLLNFSRNSRAQLATIQASHSFLMVETTAYFEAYRYVLEGLQEQDEDNLPFQSYIVECNPDVHPPAYFMLDNITYDLASIATEGHAGSVKPFNPLNPTAWPTEEQMGLDDSQLNALKLALTKELAIIQGPPGTGKTYVGLKIAKALLKNSGLWSANSPMLVVCYTNHALDQFLEGIHSFLKKGIVRVGGRSNSEILKHFSLRELTRVSNFRRDLPAHLKKAYSEIHREMQYAQTHLNAQTNYLECSLRGIINESFLQKYISDDHWETLILQPKMMGGFQNVGKKQSLIMEWLCLGMFQQQTSTDKAEANDEGEPEEEEQLLEMDEEAALIEAERILDDSDPKARDDRKIRMEEETLTELSEQMLAMNLHEAEQQPSQGQGQGQVNDEEWQMQKHQKKKMKQRVKFELRKNDAMSEEEEQRVWNVWELKLNDRWRLYRLWVLRYQIDLRRKALEAEQHYQDAAERLAEIRRREDLCVLKHAKVIGMTTTGAAKYRQVLQELKPRLVIVEEAAEVLEAHVITTLSRDCQHLILIGDHQQLRPSATVYELAKNFNLEVSMFERLVKVGFPFVRLNYQHRMRPDIACLLTPHIYSELENHASVLAYENIKGVLTNLFFLDHKSHEEEIRDGRSHQNLHEAHFVVDLCRYLLRQEYQPSQITILTTYTGQLYCLRKLMPSAEFSGVKVHVVDKYQGEENDIVILSLVRSNQEGRVGFLQIPNRVCVALSRAKKGLYCIGNMGLCGDPCPDKCRICHRDDVIEIFFGNEDEPDACFIQLEDCKHIIESTGMDQYMSMDEHEGADQDQRAIRLKECPRCRTPIRRNVRYGAHINRSLAEIEKVKEQINGLQSDNKIKQEELKLLLERQVNFMEQLPYEHLKMTENLQKSGLSILDLWHHENLIVFLENLGKLMKMQKDHSFSVQFFDCLFSLRIDECLNFLLDKSQRFSDQQVHDLEREMKRLSYLCELSVCCSMASNIMLRVKVNAEVTKVRHILEDTGPFTENDEEKVKEIFKELENMLPRSGLGVTDEERVMIVKAMALPQGHWYKCPNGHVYAIGDCGGAMVHSQCPDCKATIGGANHALTE
ncbi:hypothetical protein QTP86_018421, partial [Hemibagrus guttatus]